MKVKVHDILYSLQESLQFIKIIQSTMEEEDTLISMYVQTNNFKDGGAESVRWGGMVYSDTHRQWEVEGKDCHFRLQLCKVVTI